MLSHWFNHLSKQKQQLIPFCGSIAALIAIHYLTTLLPRGWAAWGFAVLPLLIIIITAIARVKDSTLTGWQGFTRKLGFIMAGSGAFALLVAPVLGYSNAFPSWRAVTLYWGFALVWFTTPNVPPWWKYISGEWKAKDTNKV